MGFFVAGSVLFFLGHLCNLIQLTIFLFKSDTKIPFIAYFIFAISLALIIRFVFPLTKRYAGKLALLANVYMPILVFIGVFSLLVTAAYADSYQGLFQAKRTSGKRRIANLDAIAGTLRKDRKKWVADM